MGCDFESFRAPEAGVWGLGVPGLGFEFGDWAVWTVGLVCVVLWV